MTEFRPSRFNILPSVVKNIVIINVLIAVLQLVLFRSLKINLQDHFALHWNTVLHEPWQLVTHMFMHGSPASMNMTVLHLFGNMLGLWMLGSILENVWGAKRFLIFYFVCGIGAALCHLGVLTYEFTTLHNAITQFQQHPDPSLFAQLVNRFDMGTRYTNLGMFQAQWVQNPSVPDFAREAVRFTNEYYESSINEATVGASGAVFGVLFAFGYLFPNTLLYFYFFIPIKAKWFVGLYALFELYSGVQASAGDNVAHFAHLGGLLFAFILLKIWNYRLRNKFY